MALVAVVCFVKASIGFSSKQLFLWGFTAFLSVRYLRMLDLAESPVDAELLLKAKACGIGDCWGRLWSQAR